MKGLFKLSIISMVIIGILAMGFFYWKRQNPQLSTENIYIEEDKNFDEKKDYAKNEYICLNFILNKLSSSSGGIYTNYLDDGKKSEYASGHEILSESIGLAMLYFVENNNRKLFDRQLKYMEQKMTNEVGLIKWRIREDNVNLSKTSATIDDLRIIRALLHASLKWDDKKYLYRAYEISQAVYKYNVEKNYLCNYYDLVAKEKNHEIDLSYIDLFTIRGLSNIDEKWTKVLKVNIDIVKEGFISEELPLYYKTYDLERKAFKGQSKINSIDALLVLLHLSEINMAPQSSIDWIKSQFDKYNGVYMEYNVKTGTPFTKEESTAVYAIIARIAKQIEDKDLYHKAISRMISLQVQNPSSEIYGSFGNDIDKKVFSFDNLQALLAF